jgi:hypothetical protein
MDTRLHVNSCVFVDLKAILGIDHSFTGQAHKHNGPAEGVAQENRTQSQRDGGFETKGGQVPISNPTTGQGLRITAEEVRAQDDLRGR